MKGTFEDILEVILDVEGDFSDHPDDPGGKTHYGITQATLNRAQEAGLIAEDVTIENLTLDHAEKIYRCMFWDAVHADILPDGLDLAVFDAAVNHGPRRATKMLQRAMNVVIRWEGFPEWRLKELRVDGLWGPKTREAVNILRGDLSQDSQLIREFMLRRFLTWDALNKAVFEKGWFRRGVKITQAATALAHQTHFPHNDP